MCDEFRINFKKAFGNLFGTFWTRLKNLKVARINKNESFHFRIETDSIPSYAIRSFLIDGLRHALAY